MSGAILYEPIPQGQTDDFIRRARSSAEYSTGSITCHSNISHTWISSFYTRLSKNTLLRATHFYDNNLYLWYTWCLVYRLYLRIQDGDISWRLPCQTPPDAQHLHQFRWTLCKKAIYNAPSTSLKSTPELFSGFFRRSRQEFPILVQCRIAGSRLLASWWLSVTGHSKGLVNIVCAIQYLTS